MSRIRGETPEELKRRWKSWNKTKKETVQRLIDDAKSRPCADCGDAFPHYVLTFDHRDGSSHIGRKSNDGRPYSMKQHLLRIGKEKQIEELNKCDVVCYNCHAVRTYKRLHPEEFPGG